jgi:translation initiation factor 3 subunit I
VFNVWFTSNGERLGTFNGHNGTIWSISCDCTSPSRLPFGKRKKADQVAKSKYIVSGAADSSMKLWDIQSGKCLYTWDFLTAVKRVQFRLVFFWVFSTVADGLARMIRVS